MRDIFRHARIGLALSGEVDNGALVELRQLFELQCVDAALTAFDV
jgi:hypothetical protein